MRAHRVDPQLHRAVAEQIPRVGKLEKLAAFNRENYVLFKAYIERHRDEVWVDDLELASFICVTAVEALTHNAVLSGRLSDKAMDALIAETTRLITGYLKA